MRAVWDIEANGLYEEATEVHCIVFKFLETGEVVRLYDTSRMDIKRKEGDLSLDSENLLSIFNKLNRLICHNQLGYDVWMVKKFYAIDLVEMFQIPNLIDTFVWSQALYPDRPMPRYCPTSIKMPTGKNKRIGPHGLESWGYRVAKKKPMISDWSTFNNDILIRCEEDVLINEDTYYELLKEGGLDNG